MLFSKSKYNIPFKSVLSFAEITQNIEVCKGAEPLVIMSDGLPISRRDYIKWCNEIDHFIPKSVFFLKLILMAVLFHIFLQN